MNRYLLSLLSLAAVLFWLLFSYLPPSIVVLPQVDLQLVWPGLLFQILAVLGLIVFLSIQFRILWATVQMRELAAVEAPASGQGVRLLGVRLVAELFWTALPIVMTVGLALISWPIWHNLRP